MRRLLHSKSGYLRRMQISTTQVFVFVEGIQSDGFFYGSIFSAIRDPNFTFTVKTAKELPSTSGGKKAILDFFSYLRSSKKLLSALGGKKTACLFYVDKDVDDIQRIKKRSPHLVYTEHYDVQNYIFLHGDLLKGAAAAASVNPVTLTSSLADSSTWCMRAAKFWLEWVTICLFVLTEDIEGEANYRITSSIQTRPCGSINPTTYATFKSNLQIKSKLSPTVFQQRFDRLSKKVESYYRQGLYHRIFKGKWFTNILADDIEQLMNGTPFDRGQLERHLPCAIAATLDFSGLWTKYLTEPIIAVARAL